MKPLYVIGADFGTDSVRCILVDTADGRILAQEVVYYPRWKAGLFCDTSRNMYRQHPSDYIESFTECVKGMLSKAKSADPSVESRVAGISFDMGKVLAGIAANKQKRKPAHNKGFPFLLTFYENSLSQNMVCQTEENPFAGAKKDQSHGKIPGSVEKVKGNP